MKFKMDRMIRKYCRRFVKMNFYDEKDNIEQKAENYYQQFCHDAPDIGVGKNLMASNLYQFLTFLAYYEASDRRISKNDIEIIVGWMLSDLKPIGKLIDMNKVYICKLFYNIVRLYNIKLMKMKKDGKWGNTWCLLINPENHHSGFSIHLVGCPLYDFAITHGYEDILPLMCQIDHEIAALMHSKLIRKHTIATGGECCDYWYVGDKTNIE